MPELELSISAASRRLGKSYWVVWSYVAAGRLAARRDEDGRWRVDAAAVEHALGELVGTTAGTTVGKSLPGLTDRTPREREG